MVEVFATRNKLGLGFGQAWLRKMLYNVCFVFFVSWLICGLLVGQRAYVCAQSGHFRLMV